MATAAGGSLSPPYSALTEGRARALDRVNLRDRVTYGVDWIVLEATSAGDGLRQWRLFKAGTHPRQGALEREAARYKAGAPGYAAPWEAETEVAAMRTSDTLEALDARRRRLAEEDADLASTRRALTGRAARPAAKRTARAKPKAKARKKTTVKRKTARGKARKPKKAA